MQKDKRTLFKELKEQFQTSKNQNCWNFSSQKILVPKGAFIEVFGNARREVLIEFLRDQRDLTVAWVESELTLFPPSVAQRDVDVTRWLLVEAGENLLWVVEELLTSHFFSVILVSEMSLTAALWRRFQRECERGGTTLFLLSEQPHEQVGSLFVLESERRGDHPRLEWSRCRQALTL